MRTIIDLGSRFIKIIITDGNNIYSKHIHTSEGIRNGLIYDQERLSESIFEAIDLTTKNLLDDKIITSNEILKNIYLTTSINHCFVSDKIDETNLSNNPTLKAIDNKENEEEIYRWLDQYLIGDIYLENPIDKINKNIKHHKISIKMEREAQIILRDIFLKKKANLKHIFFNNCNLINDHDEIRIDVGYSSTRIFSHNNIQIIQTGLYDLIKNISNINHMPLRQTEKILQISNQYNDIVNSVAITKQCQTFIIELFTDIINKQKKLNDKTKFILQGGINYVPFICDFIESKFAIPTKQYTTYQYNNLSNENAYINCLSVLSKLENLDILNYG